ncbi:thiol peroxidase, partial [Deltaproteobacteria bacterium PRO3]|nr:MAG: thiol peroxidase [Acidobacteriota bacterium]MCE7957598.1 thiol peroxidase [Acidobacteria bacterium ACB2]MDL1873049.1 thiol peroxidase [Deltaproteobacteria bacterium PRO3]
MERTGVITYLGGPLTLVGPEVEAGDRAPDFTVLDNGLGAKTLADFAGKTLVISVTPSLDTPICDAQLRRFNDEAARIGDDVAVLNVSMDLPFANKRFCSVAGIEKALTLSDHRDASFGTAYGVLIKELRLLARAIFVVGKDGVVKHAEIVPEVTHHPDYDKALAAAR